MEGADMRMVELRDRACFAFKACAELLTRNFDGYCPVQPNIQSSEDLSHAARTDRRNDLVRAEFVAYRKPHMGDAGLSLPHQEVDRS
jgi:hypothetical protein